MEDSRLLGNDQLVQLGRAFLVVPLVAQDSRQTLFDELFGNVAGVSALYRHVDQKDRLVESQLRNSLVLVAIGDRHAFLLLVVTLPGLDVVDQNMHSLANEAFTQEPDY